MPRVDTAWRQSPRGHRFGLAGVVALLVVITALQVLPAPARLGTHVMPNAGDPVLVTWILEHQARALLSDPRMIYQANIFFPDPSAIAWSDNGTLFVPLYLVAWLGSGRNSVLAYNVVTLLAFAGTNIAVLVFARRLLQSPVAAALVAIAFSVAMVRLTAVGHLTLAGVAFLPLAVALLMDLVERRKVATAVLAGVSVAALWYTAIYFFVLAVVVIPVFALVWVARNWHQVTARLLALTAASAAVAALLVAPSLPPYLDVQERASFARSDDELITIERDSFHQPSSLVYRALDEADPIHEGADAFVGLTVPALAFLGVLGSGLSVAGRRLTRGGQAAASRGALERATACQAAHRPCTIAERRRRFAAPLAVTSVVAAMLSFGPGHGLVSVPYELLRQAVPGLDSARALNRFWTVPVLAVALLAGRTLERLTERSSWTVQWGAGVLVVAVVLAELFVRPSAAEVPLSPQLVAINESLASLEPGPVTELPVAAGPDMPYVLAARQLRSLEDGLPRVEGYSGDAPEGVDVFLQAMSTFPSDASIAALRQAGVRHVLLQGAQTPCVSRYGRNELSALVEAAQRSPAVEHITRLDTGAIVTLWPAPRGGPLSALAVVPPAERTAPPCRWN